MEHLTSTSTYLDFVIRQIPTLDKNPSVWIRSPDI